MTPSEKGTSTTSTFLSFPDAGEVAREDFIMAMLILRCLSFGLDCRRYDCSMIEIF